MTTAAVSLQAPLEAGERPSLFRLTLVELRKMVDTRAGLWLQIGTVALTVGVVAAFFVFAKAGDLTLAAGLSAAVQPAGIVLPILGVLLVTSEWSQRTAMITFALVPDRSRVLAAKLLAGLLLALAATAVCLPVAAIGTVFAPGGGDTWSLPPELLGRVTLSVVISMFLGLAFGAMLLSSAPAIVLYFVLPFVGTALGSIPQLKGIAGWLDPIRTLAPLQHRAVMSATEWAHLGTTLALWFGVPLLVGLWRITRGEIR
jgi:ABC-type transport system involved in multi-copper enzyme maturation permease subunit